MKKDIRKQVWDRAFDDLDENGDKIEKPKKIKSDWSVNRARSNRLQAKNSVWIKNQKEGSKKAWDDPIRKKERSKYWKDPAFLEKISKQRKDLNKDPEIKKKKSEIAKKLHADPKYNKNYREGVARRVAKGPSESQLEKNKELGMKRRKTLSTPDGIFVTIKSCAEFYGLAVGSIQTRMANYPESYFYIDENGKRLEPKKLKVKSVYTPDGVFKSVEEAAFFYGVSPSAIHYRTKKRPDDYYYIT
jgi:hypothetical protein